MDDVKHDKDLTKYKYSQSPIKRHPEHKLSPTKPPTNEH